MTISTSFKLTIYTIVSDIADELIELIQQCDDTGDRNITINKCKSRIIEIDNFLKKLIKMRVSGCKEYSDEDLAKLYSENKLELENQKETLKNAERDIVTNHKNAMKIKEIKELVASGNKVNQIKVFADKIAKVIVMSPEEIVICIEDSPFTDEGFLENINKVVNYKAIVEDIYYHKSTNKAIKFKVVKIGDELDE